MKIIFVFSVLFLFHFSFQHIFYHHFSLIIFPFIFLFIPSCFLLLFLFYPSPLFLYFSISVFLFLFFSLPHVSFSVFLHLLFCVSPFLLSNFLLFSLLILISLFSFFFFTLFTSSSSLLFFCFKKNSKFSVVNFLKTNVSFFFFSNPPVICIFSRVFSSLRRHFSLFVQCFLFFRDSSLFLFLIFFYRSSFWVSSKNRFVFERNQKIIDFFVSILLFLKNIFLIFPLFALKPSPMHDLQKTCCHLSVFSNSF